MNKKKKLQICIFILTILAIFIICLFITAYNDKPTIEEKEEYKLIVIDEKIRLLNIDKIIKTYDINLNVLPPTDIKKLYDGITVSSVAEAETIIEDYDG